MIWGATMKEVEYSNFFLEVPKIFYRFWRTILISLLTLAMIVVLALPFMPQEWAIDGSGWAVILPLACVQFPVAASTIFTETCNSVQAACHILYPIVLNPWLLLFTY
jgi:hypothetical protein